MGIQISVRGNVYVIHGTIMLVSGDNLVSQFLADGGYKSLASAFRKCRNCMAVKEDMVYFVFYYSIIICSYSFYLSSLKKEQ